MFFVLLRLIKKSLTIGSPAVVVYTHRIFMTRTRPRNGISFNEIFLTENQWETQYQNILKVQIHFN